MINCSEIQQNINALLIAFADCNKIKNSDLTTLVELIQALNDCDSSGSLKQDNKFVIINYTLAQIGATSFEDDIETLLAEYIVLQNIEVNEIQLYIFKIQDGLNNQIYILNNKGKGELNDINNDDLFLLVNDTNRSNYIKSNESLALAQRVDNTLYGILDQYTGEEITLEKTTNTNDADGIIYFDLGAEKFKRVFTFLNVKWFGAKGDGVTDDTIAFRNANSTAYNFNGVNSNQNPNIVVRTSISLIIPSGVYIVKGDRILGSPLEKDDTAIFDNRIAFNLISDSATIKWDILNSSDVLFNFDGTIDNPFVKGLNILTTSESNTIEVGGTIFNFYSNTSPGESGASKSHFEDVYVLSGLATSNPSFATKPEVIFNITGNTQADQGLILNCRFSYFKTFFKCENQEAVSWSVYNSGFFGGGVPNCIYFDFEAMGDSFNVSNCSFSVSTDEILLKTRAKIVGGISTQTGGFGFNFDNNRIEIYGDADDSWFLTDMDFGRLNFRNTNFLLGSGTAVKTIISTFGQASVNFENTIFNEAEFRMPILTTPYITGNSLSYGGVFQNCAFLNDLVEFKYYDGTTIYPLKDILISDLLYRSVLVKNCHYYSGNGFLNFEISNNNEFLDIAPKNNEIISLSKNGVALTNTFILPPYQILKNISISIGILPSTFDKFRIYFGDKTIYNNYIDVDNPRPGEVKSNLVLFSGMATVFTKNLNHQSITVYALDSGVEAGALISSLTIEYEAIDCNLLGIADNDDVIIVNQNTKEFSIPLFSKGFTATGSNSYNGSLNFNFFNFITDDLAYYGGGAVRQFSVDPNGNGMFNGKVSGAAATASNDFINLGQLTAVNTTTSLLSLATLNATYPAAFSGFEVHCRLISTGPIIYKKDVSGWLEIKPTIVV
jgi:hypothetical protein